ncbi:phosphatase PAP2 family protein [Candidatus Poribacteria bacterium]|nr:phosphatase PAP2 family protein [Candidatus Poribacteria bacterium]
MDAIINSDHIFFIYINNNFPHNQILNSIFGIFNLLGNWWLLTPICLSLIYIYNKPKIINYSILLLICALVSGTILHFLKWLIERPRPLREFELLIEQGKMIVYVLDEKLQGNNSFPSGHTQTAFTAAAFLNYLFKKNYSILLFSLAFMVGIARIYSGVHFPLDVLGGILIGVIPTYIILKIYKKKFDSN